MPDFEQWMEQADSRETSERIMYALWQVANCDADAAERLWEGDIGDNGPAIINIATDFGRYSATEMYWGAAGQCWANQLKT